MNNILKYENKQDLLNNNKGLQQIVVADYTAQQSVKMHPHSRECYDSINIIQKIPKTLNICI